MFNKKLAILLTALSLSAMTLCGCGSAGTTAEKAESTEAAPAATQEVALDEGFVDGIKEAGKLVVGCKMDVPNLGYYEEETDTWSGLEVELAYKTAAALFGVSSDEAKEKGLVEFVGVTVADREQKLEDGEIDCMLATYTITDARKERFALSDDYYTDYIGIMVRYTGEDSNSLGSNNITSIADLDGKYIGVPRNATTRDTFISYIETMNTMKVNPIFCEYESYDQLFTALKNGNIDAMSVDVSILGGYVDNSTKILDVRFGGQHYGAAVKKENAALLEYVNQAIAE